MSIETEISNLITQAIETAATAQNAVIADMSKRITALEKGITPTQAPPASPPPAVADDPPGTVRVPRAGETVSVRWKGDAWSVTLDRKVARNGQPATTPDLTANVTSIGIDDQNRLVHTNAARELRYFDGRPDWPLVYAPASISVSGSIGRTA